jgi:hypothetical protein
LERFSELMLSIIVVSFDKLVSLAFLFFGKA